MIVIIVFVVVLVLLFVLAFMTKRRFGVLGLALAAGSMLSELWADQLTPLVRDAGLVVQSPPLISIVSVVLVLLPAVFLLFSGPSYQDASRRILGATLFATLAFALLIEPLGSALVLQGDGRMIYEFLEANRVYIVTLGLILAVFDLLGTHTSRHYKPAKH
ncbi:MAG: hypothetical protein WBK76_04560 [Candidatus Saccharimonadales bacterium]